MPRRVSGAPDGDGIRRTSDRAVFEQTNESEMGVVNSEFYRRSYGSFIRKKFIYIHLLRFWKFWLQEGLEIRLHRSSFKGDTLSVINALRGGNMAMSSFSQS